MCTSNWDYEQHWDYAVAVRRTIHGIVADLNANENEDRKLGRPEASEGSVESEGSRQFRFRCISRSINDTGGQA
jgi:hypothetical protein